MRGFQNSSGGSSGEYRSGVVSGIAATFLLLAVARALALALENPVVAEVQAWATTPMFTPIDILGMIGLLLLVLLVGIAASLGPRL